MGKRRETEAAGPNTRQLRVGELIRHTLAEVLQRDEIRDPDVAGRSVTVTEVTVSVDMRNATVFVEPLGGQDVEAVIDGLNRSARYLGGRVARAVKMKYAPKLVFRRDRSFDNAMHIDRLLRDATSGNGPKGGNGGDQSGGQGPDGA